MSIIWAMLLVLLLLIAWLTNVLGLPGNWLMLICATLYWLWMPEDTTAAIGTTLLLVLAGLAVLGEVLELMAGSAGVSKAGGTRRSAIYAILGSIGGAIVGFVVGVPIPVVGSLVGSLLLGSLGAMAGAMLGERSRPRLDAESANRQSRLLGPRTRDGS
jgi:uncharacterized protein YqgC (DUF456 family)